MGVENEIDAISAFNEVVVEVEAELGKNHLSPIGIGALPKTCLF